MGGARGPSFSGHLGLAGCLWSARKCGGLVGVRGHDALPQTLSSAAAPLLGLVCPGPSVGLKGARVSPSRLGLRTRLVESAGVSHVRGFSVFPHGSCLGLPPPHADLWHPPWFPDLERAGCRPRHPVLSSQLPGLSHGDKWGSSSALPGSLCW